MVPGSVAAAAAVFPAVFGIAGVAAAGAPGLTTNSSRRIHHGMLNCPLTGVRYNMPLSALPAGWHIHYMAPYAQATRLADVYPSYGNPQVGPYDCLLWGALPYRHSPTFTVAAMGDRRQIETQRNVWDNEVYWYTTPGMSSGFSSNSNIDLQPGDRGLFHCAGRLSWLLELEQGGYRAGCTENLYTDESWFKVVMYGPQAVFCPVGICDDLAFTARDGYIYCMEAVCRVEECCAQRDRCAPETCHGGSLLKPEVPEYCEGTWCRESECCEARALCHEGVCPPGYNLMPFGLPQYGCATNPCSLHECCEEAPLCTQRACGEGEVPLEPQRHCRGYDCLSADCCTAAGRCDAGGPGGAEGLCTGDYQAKAASDWPAWCAGLRCTVPECCDLLPPRGRFAAQGRLLDLDLDVLELGGRVTWLPPPGGPEGGALTGFSVYLGSSPAERRLVGRTAWGTNSLDLPADTPSATYLYIHTANSAGDQEEPARFAVSDLALTPEGVSFSDLDLDLGEVGGNVSWAQSFANVRGGVAAVCLSGMPVTVDVGGGTANFSVGTQLINVSAADDGITVVELSENMTTVLGSHTFTTGAGGSESSASFVGFLDKVPINGGILLAALGAAAVGLQEDAMAAIVELGGFGVAHLGAHDAYALIGVKGSSEAISESLVKAGTNLTATARLECPISHYNVYVANSPTVASGSAPTIRSFLGRVEFVGAHSDLTFPIPAETLLRNVTHVWVLAVSPLGEQTSATSLFIQDVAASVFSPDFQIADGQASYELGGTLTWIRPQNLEAVRAYHVYLASGEAGTERLRVGGRVGADATRAVLPLGTLQRNFTHILIYTVSLLGEQSTPVALSIEDLRGAALAAAMVGVLGVVQAARVAVAFNAAANTAGGADLSVMERVAVKMVNKNIKPGDIQGTFTDGKGGTKVVVGGSEIPFVRSILSPLCPKRVHHHPAKISLKDAERQTRTTLYRHQLCQNSWDGSGMLLRKLTNRKVSIQGLRYDTVVLTRKELIVDTPRIRLALRFVVPFILMIGIAAIIMGLEDMRTGLAVVAAAVFCIFLVVCISRSRSLQSCARAVAALPPASIRDRFWRAAGVVVGVLPCVPAFMSMTWLGLLTGLLAVLAAVLLASDAFRAAFIVEFGGGATLAVVTLLLRFQEGFDGNDEITSGKNLAAFLASTLLFMKCIDSFLATRARLFLDEDLPPDGLVLEAERAAATTGVPLCSALVLEAFGSGLVEAHMAEELDAVLRSAAAGLVRCCHRALSEAQGELRGPVGFGWSSYAQDLEEELGPVFGAAAGDFGAQELEQVSGIDDLAQTSGLGADWHVLVDEVLQGHVSPLVLQFHGAVQKLVSHALGNKSVARAKRSVASLRSAAGGLGAFVAELKRCAGAHAGTGRLATGMILGLQATTVAMNANELRCELSAGALSALDLYVLQERVGKMREQAARMRDLVGPEGAAAGVASGATRQSAARVHEGVLALSMMAAGGAPTPGEAHSMVGGLDDIIKHAWKIARAGRRTERLGLANEEDEAVEFYVADSVGEFGNDELIHDATAAHYVVRSVVGYADVVGTELVSTAESMTSITKMLADARSECKRLSAATEDARANLKHMSPQLLRQIRDDAVKFVRGPVTGGLMRLQDLALDEVHATYACLQKENKQLAEEHSLDTTLWDNDDHLRAAAMAVASMQSLGSFASSDADVKMLDSHSHDSPGDS